MAAFLRCILLSGGMLLLSFSVWEQPGRLAHAQEAKTDPAATRQYSVGIALQKKKLYPQAAARWAKFIAAFPKDPRLANAHHNLGICQLQQKQWKEAEASFTNVLAKFAQFKSLDAVHLNLGMVHYNLALASKKPADYKKAAATFAVVAAKFSKSEHAPAALYYQAECLHLSEDVPATLPIYQKLIATYPQSRLLPDAHYALGTAQQELGQDAQAATTFQAFLQKFPKDRQHNECKLRFGLALFNQKKYEESEKVFAEAAAIPEFEYADVALLRQAESLFERKQLPQAAAVYESLPKKFAKSPYIGAALLSAGKCRFEAGEFPQAQTDLSAVVTQKLAEAAESAFWLGRTLIKLKKPADAVAVLDQAIKASPKSEFLPQLTFTRIDALYEQPEHQKETIAAYANFAKQHPMHELASKALYMAALVALKLEEYVPAQTHGESFLANPTFAKHALVPEVLYIGGLAYLSTEKPDVAKAELLFGRLVAEHKDHVHAPEAHVRIGMCRYLAKKYDDAVKAIEPVVGGLKDPALKAEAYLLVGQSHKDAKRLPQAVTAFRNARKSKPDWNRGDEILLALGTTLQVQGELDAAITELTQLNSTFPKSEVRDRALFRLGELADSKKSYDVAIKHYTQVVAEFPKSDVAAPAQYAIGSAWFAKKDFKQTVPALSKLLSEYAKSDVVPRGHYLRGLCYQRLEQFEPAIKDFNTFLGTKPVGRETLDARFALGLCQVGSKQNAIAVATFAALLKDKPDYPQADRAYYEMAFALQADKKPKEATAAFRQLATKLPESPLVAESWLRVGEFHEKSKEFAESEKAYNAGLAKAKDSKVRESLQYGLGWARYQQNKFDEAATVLKELVKEHPQGSLLADANFLVGESFFRQKKYKEALPSFAAVVQAKAEKYHARSLYRSGTCQASLKEWPVSRSHYEALIKQFPKFELINEARYGLGLALQNEKKLDAAIAVFEQITKETNNETAAKAHFMIGECAFAQKKFMRAIEHFVEVTDGFPEKEPYTQWQALAHFEAGRCFIELKDSENAIVSLNMVVKKFPKHPRAKNAAELIANLKKNEKDEGAVKK